MMLLNVAPVDRFVKIAEPDLLVKYGLGLQMVLMTVVPPSKLKRKLDA